MILRGEARLMPPIAGGSDAPVGAPAAPANPWAAYGLNPDGSELKPEAKPDAGAGAEAKSADPVVAELAGVKAKLAAAEAKLADLPADFKGMNEKFKVVDRLVKALGGDEPVKGRFKEVWGDLKNVAKDEAPGFLKLMERLEKEPNLLEKYDDSLNALAGSRLGDLNTQAHDRVAALARTIWKKATPAEIEEFVYPFEKTMTDAINADDALRRQFVGGNLKVVDDMFQRLVRPHVANRLREKQDRMAPSTFPRATPTGAGQPGAGDDGAPKKPNIHTPQGKMDFHKAAVGRWLDKRRTTSDE